MTTYSVDAKTFEEVKAFSQGRKNLHSELSRALRLIDAAEEDGWPCTDKALKFMEDIRALLAGLGPKPDTMPSSAVPKHTCRQPSFGYPQGREFDCPACIAENARDETKT